MITIFINPETTISQRIYDNIIVKTAFDKLQCTCGQSGCLFAHGYYYRSIKKEGGKIRLKICRVRCKQCQITHAFLLSSIVPYSQIPVSEQKNIVYCHEKGISYENILQRNPNISESDIRHVIRRYRNHWKSLLCSRNLLITSYTSLFQFVSQCFIFFQHQFLQIKQTSNLIYYFST